MAGWWLAYGWPAQACSHGPGAASQRAQCAAWVTLRAHRGPGGRPRGHSCIARVSRGRTRLGLYFWHGPRAHMAVVLWSLFFEMTNGQNQNARERKSAGRSCLAVRHKPQGFRMYLASDKKELSLHTATRGPKHPQMYTCSSASWLGAAWRRQSSLADTPLPRKQTAPTKAVCPDTPPHRPAHSGARQAAHRPTFRQHTP